MEVYKIRCKETGLYSTGGLNPKFTKKGKMWTTKGDLTAHLRMVYDYYEKDETLKNYLHNTEVVVFEVVEYRVRETLDMLPSRTT